MLGQHSHLTALSVLRMHQSILENIAILLSCYKTVPDLFSISLNPFIERGHPSDRFDAHIVALDPG